MVAEPSHPITAELVVAQATGVGEKTLTLPVVDVGVGITAPEWEHDDYEAKQPRGAAVLVERGAPAGAPAGTDYETRSYKLARAAEAGAKAAILLTGLPAQDPSWAALRTEFMTPRVYAADADDPAAPSLGAVILASAEAEAELRAALTDAPTPELELSVDVQVRSLDDTTVIGRFAGSKHPEQSIVVLASWDAGGFDQPLLEGGGSEANGAGVAVALSLASRLGEWSEAGRRPERSVVFVFTAADSLGMFGTTQYVSTVSDRDGKLVTAVALEGFELDAPEARLTATGTEGGQLEAAIRSAFGDQLRLTEPGPEGAPTQLRTLLAGGLPALGFSRRAEGAVLDEAPVILETAELSDLARETASIFDVVWGLANASASEAD